MSARGTAERPAAYVTGVGVVSPVGVGVESFWRALVACESGVGPITLFDTEDFGVKIAAECDDFYPTDFMDRKLANKTDRFAQMGLAASRLAIEDAGARGMLEKESEKVALILGTAIGGVSTLERTAREMEEKGPLRVNPFAITRIMPNSAAAWTAIRLGMRGPSLTPAHACATGSDVIGMGLDVIRRGEADVVVCGASEALITPVIVAGFIAMRAMSRRNDDPEGACRPYDANHSGFVLGEGAGVVVLESEEHAERRGAEPYAKVTGAGRTNDAHHLADPDPEGRGILGAMRFALGGAGLDGGQIGYINPHGAGTAAGDGPESRALAMINPDALVSATKSTLGHSMGATGALEAIVCVLALKHRIVPPMRNLEELASDCAELNFVVDDPREAPGLEAALCGNVGVGGVNAAIALEQP